MINPLRDGLVSFSGHKEVKISITLRFTARDELLTGAFVWVFNQFQEHL